MNYFKRFTLLRTRKVINNCLHYKSTSTNGGSKSRKDLALYIIPVTTFALGTWQVKRLEWKNGLINDLKTKTQKPPIPLPNDVLVDGGRIKELEYRRVSVEGEFDHAKEIFIGPRALQTDKPSGGGGGLIGQSGQYGFQVVTPFVLTSGERILINRGWVPRKDKNPKSRKEGQIEGTILLTGLLRSNEKRPQFTPAVQPNSLDWHYRDVNEFSEILNTLPVLLDADSTTTIPGGPVGGQTQVHLRNEHMNYILTWYSLTAATLFMIYQYRKNPAAMFSGSNSKMRSSGVM